MTRTELTQAELTRAELTRAELTRAELTRNGVAGAQRLLVNPVLCSGHGTCAELVPELITLDEWGYPIVDGAPVPARLARKARRAVRDCPVLALLLVDAPDGQI
jgi:ferredoxin